MKTAAVRTAGKDVLVPFIKASPRVCLDKKLNSTDEGGEYKPKHSMDLPNAYKSTTADRELVHVKLAQEFTLPANRTMR